MTLRQWSAVVVFGLAAILIGPPGAGAVEVYAGVLEVAAEEAGTGGTGLDPADFQMSDGFISPDGAPGPALDALFPADDPPSGGFEYSFIQISDVQIHDRNRPPFQWLLHVFDPLVSSCEADFYQDQLDVFYLGYILKAIRAAALTHRARFIIHTGDGVHISRENELLAYTTMIEDFLLKDGRNAAGGFETSWLAAPITRDGDPASMYFNLAGNHDLFYLGNVQSARLGRNLPPASDLASAEPGDVFRNYYRLLHQLHAVSKAQARPQLLGLNPASGPVGNFDVQTPAKARAYYYFDLPIPNHPQGKKARMIVLNSSETIDLQNKDLGVGGYSGALSPTQRDWLQGLVARSDADPGIDHVIVFGHILLEDISCATPGHRRLDPPGFLIPEFEASPKVIAYLNGHDHQGHTFRKHDKDGHLKVLLYTVPSIMNSPKNFVRFTVRSERPGSYELIPRLYNLDDLADAGALGGAEAQAARASAEQQSATLDHDACIARGRRRCLDSFIADLDRMDLTAPRRALHLAFLCLGRAYVDADANRSDPDKQVHDEWTREEWKMEKARFEQSATIEK